jgi:hypothetical protein
MKFEKKKESSIVLYSCYLPELIIKNLAIWNILSSKSGEFG